MKIGLLDIDSHNYPNLPLMKISAWHKAQGDEVTWYDAFEGMLRPYDIVYKSKVFSFSDEYEHPIYAEKIVGGGTGYAISLVDGREVFDRSKDVPLPYEIEHIMPDYSLYGITDTAYGFMSRGCPRGCFFCHIKDKAGDGTTARKVADLSEFWHGQKNIMLCDPNVLAVKEREDLLQQLIDSKAWVDINQGLDIRLMTEELTNKIMQLKVKLLHFAWDRIEDGDIVKPRFEAFKRQTGFDRRKMIVYVLVGDRERHVTDADLERIYWLRDHGYWPYVMIYDKEHLPEGTDLRKLSRWVNNRPRFERVKRFEDYKGNYKEDEDDKA